MQIILMDATTPNSFNILLLVKIKVANPEAVVRLVIKVALPIFENFVKKAIKKSDARPFKVADGITMMIVDPLTGQKAKFSSKNT